MVRDMTREYPKDINELTKDIVAWRIEKGFQTTWSNVEQKVLLVVEEIGESASALRKEDKENFGEDLADAIIRLLDLMGSLGYNPHEAIKNKMLINEGRPYEHGKKF